MITPEQITKKAVRLYPRVVQAWLDQTNLFPIELRASKKLSHNISQDIAAVQALRAGSKTERGFGYSVDWTQRRTKSSGRNEVPTRIYFETEHDLLKLIGKTAEFKKLTTDVAKIRANIPELEPWI